LESGEEQHHSTWEPVLLGEIQTLKIFRN
jgi:hypothetical protein